MKDRKICHEQTEIMKGQKSRRSTQNIKNEKITSEDILEALDIVRGRLFRGDIPHSLHGVDDSAS